MRISDWSSDVCSSDLYDSVRDAIVRLAGTAVSGSCFRPETTMTPVQNRMQFDRVWSLFDDAIARGARAAVGGERHRGEGLFIPPTLVEGVGGGVRLVDERSEESAVGKDGVRPG